MSLSGAWRDWRALSKRWRSTAVYQSGFLPAGFDSIALALIGNNHPLGVVLSSLLFGSLRNGATRMMVVSAFRSTSSA